MANPNPGASMDNTMMQMRKACNHPYLFEAPVDGNGDWLIDEGCVEACGKMVLLDRMLKILRKNGNKVFRV
jgi:SNF2 family DNA or RNA helicase